MHFKIGTLASTSDIWTVNIFLYFSKKCVGVVLAYVLNILTFAFVLVETIQTDFLFWTIYRESEN